MKEILLGKKVEYIDRYDKNLLMPIPRSEKRNELGIDNHEIFHNGFDLWNCYEISWLDSNNKPQVRVGEIFYHSDSEFIVESKSLKLYLNSFNGMNFDSDKQVSDLIKKDLSEILKTEVKVALRDLDKIEQLSLPDGGCIDDIDLKIPVSEDVNPSFLRTNEEEVEETLYSNLLKSNCLITNQPDWATVEISYLGRKINRSGLLQYIISFRNHNEFHEQCVERILLDILKRCKPQKLSVYARYTRRGGIDINPFRSTEKNYKIINKRLVRQ